MSSLIERLLAAHGPSSTKTASASDDIEKVAEDTAGALAHIIATHAKQAGVIIPPRSTVQASGKAPEISKGTQVPADKAKATTPVATQAISGKNDPNALLQKGASVYETLLAQKEASGAKPSDATFLMKTKAEDRHPTRRRNVAGTAAILGGLNALNGHRIGTQLMREGGDAAMRRGLTIGQGAAGAVTGALLGGLYNRGYATGRASSREGTSQSPLRAGQAVMALTGNPGLAVAHLLGRSKGLRDGKKEASVIVPERTTVTDAAQSSPAKNEGVLRKLVAGTNYAGLTARQLAEPTRARIGAVFANGNTGREARIADAAKIIPAGAVAGMKLASGESVLKMLKRRAGAENDQPAK